MHGSAFVADLAIVLGVAALTALVARRLGQPTILGYLFAGLIVGPYLPVPLFADLERVDALAEFGVALVMFAVGLELRIERLARVLPVSGVTGLVQVGFLLWAGSTTGLLLGWSAVEAAFLGGSLAISSTMVVTRLFDEIDVARDVRDNVLAILVVQDVLAIALIAGFTALAAGGGLEPAALGLVLTKLLGVLVGLIAFGLLLVPRFVRRVAATRSGELLVVVAIGLCFAMGYLAEVLGYSVALGSFVAGVLVAESGRAKKVEHLIAPLRDVFAAVFFVSVGMTVEPGEALLHLPTTLLVVGLVAAGQLLVVGFAGVFTGSGLRRSVTSGLALGQIGEFGFIISGLGVSAGAARPELRPIVVTAAVLTAFTTPALLRRADAIARFADHHLPDRVLRLIGLYERWFERWRRGSEARPGSQTRPFRNVVFDAAATILALALALAWEGDAVRWLVASTGLGRTPARLLFGVALLLLVGPLLLGLFRNTLALSALVANDVAPSSPTDDAGAGIVRRMVRSTIYLLVALGVGVPALAVLRPLMPGPVGLPLLALVLVGIGVLILRDVQNLDREVRSGAALVAARLAREMGTEHPATVDLAPAKPGVPPVLTLPGLDAVRGWRIPEGAYGEGRSLAELDLRAASGAAVVTVQRGDEVIALPKGDEVLEAGDVLGMLGSAESLAAAQALLLDGPPTRPERARPRDDPAREPTVPGRSSDRP